MHHHNRQHHQQNHQANGHRKSRTVRTWNLHLRDMQLFHNDHRANQRAHPSCRCHSQRWPVHPVQPPRACRNPWAAGPLGRLCLNFVFTISSFGVSFRWVLSLSSSSDSFVLSRSSSPSRPCSEDWSPCESGWLQVGSRAWLVVDALGRSFFRRLRVLPQSPWPLDQ